MENRVDATGVDIESGLHEFIDNLQVKINDINLDIYQTFCDPRHY